MGYIKHNAIICTSFDGDHIEKVRNEAKRQLFKIFDSDKMVSDVVEGIANGYYSFFIGPDGSKEGWDTSQEGDYFREGLIKFIESNELYVDCVDVRYGGDDYNDSIQAKSVTD